MKSQEKCSLQPLGRKVIYERVANLFFLDCCASRRTLLLWRWKGYQYYRHMTGCALDLRVCWDGDSFLPPACWAGGSSVRFIPLSQLLTDTFFLSASYVVRREKPGQFFTQSNFCFLRKKNSSMAWVAGWGLKAW